MTKTVKKQILAIRDSGRTNMFDVKTVQYLANQLGYYELVVYIEENPDGYVNFILTGKES